VSGTNTTRTVRIGFVMSTEVGWETQYKNWRAGLTPDFNIDPVWIVVSWWKAKGIVERIPLLPSGVKGRVRSCMEVRSGLRNGPFDALYFTVGHVLHCVGSHLRRQPYFIATDVTPIQLKQFGSLYGITGTRFAMYERRKHQQWVERYKNAAALFACSAWAAQSMIEDYGADPARVFVVPPGIDTDLWQFPEERALDGPIHILFVGGQFDRKGGDLLLEWARQTRHKNWRLHLVTRDTVQANDERIRVYNGLSPNDAALRALYRQAHIFALPTRGDCYSLASMEAMSSGIPVILSRTGGTGDIIRSGETGFLIEPGDGHGLAERLDYLLENPEAVRAMGKAARVDAEERFDMTGNIARTIALMRQALG
jgi:glycosyltransferase involved in cell wall biosynthesis